MSDQSISIVPKQSSFPDRKSKAKEEADKIYQGLSVDGQIEMPISDSPWGTYFGMLRDKYGIEWMVEFDAN